MKKEPSRDTVYNEEFVLKLLVFGVGVGVGVCGDTVTPHVPQRNNRSLVRGQGNRTKMLYR